MPIYSFKVSVIIPCFNAEETIVKTLQSIENQTIDNYQVILINDGSTDNTEKIILDFIENKSNYQYIKQDNMGVSSARNNGISRVKGKYISFLDADDVYHPRFLEFLYKKMETNSIDIACSKYKWLKKNDLFSDKDIEYFDEKLSNIEILERYMRKRRYKFSFCGCMYSSHIIFENDIKFDDNLKYGEDSLFIGQYLAECKSGGIFIANELYGYTINENSAMHKKVSWKNTDNIEAMKNIVDYWEKRNLDTNFSEYMISRAIWGIAKDFSVDDKLFEKLQETYDVKKAMEIMSRKCDERIVKILSIIGENNICIFKVICKLFLSF